MNYHYRSWLRRVKRRAGQDFWQMLSLYSFQSAFREGMTPREAFEDCRYWLEG